jgi:hypothetical protein
MESNASAGWHTRRGTESKEDEGKLREGSGGAAGDGIVAMRE